MAEMPERAARRVMVVDDDRIIRRHIMGLIDWNALGVEQVSEAFNGVDALCKMREEPPFLALVDVCMPQMDGLELIRRARESWPGMQFVVLSNYDEFAFVKGAFKEGTLDYVLKYELDAAGLCRAVRLAMEQYRQWSETRRMRREIQRLERWRAAEELGRTLGRRQLPRDWEPDARYGLVRLDALKPQEAGGGWEEGLMDALERAAQAGQASCFYLENAERAHFQGGLLFCVQERNPAAALLTMREAAEALCRPELLGQGLVCYSEVFEGRALAGALDELDEVASALFYYQGATLLRAGEFAPFRPLAGQEAYRMLAAEYEQLLEKRQADGAAQMVRQVVDRLRRDRPRPALARQVLDELYKRLAAVWRRQIIAQPLPVLAGEATLSVYAYCRALLDATNQAVHLLPEHPVEDAAIRAALAYIEGNLSRSLTLSEVAAQAGFSVSHFTRLFKQSTGESYVGYLNRERVRKACTYLKDPEIKLAEVARRVGFSDLRYFRKQFERYAGKSVGAYREEMNQRP